MSHTGRPLATILGTSNLIIKSLSETMTMILLQLSFCCDGRKCENWL